jgi:uncharacterized protein YdeI (YjbR/CyaY-like superfamily)
MNESVDFYIDNAKFWKVELQQLRKIILDCGLNEDFKWRAPCYNYQQNNLIIIGEYKDSCVLSFLKGVLLTDINGLLKKPGENSQSARTIKFTNVIQILELEQIIKAYIYEAIEAEKLGLKVSFIDNSTREWVEELQSKLDQNIVFKKAFDALTPGRRRAYNLYFSAAKQAETRQLRIEKYIQQIIDGKGINDCTCGLSKKMPQCDGSHKYILNSK